MAEDRSYHVAFGIVLGLGLSLWVGVVWQLVLGTILISVFLPVFRWIVVGALLGMLRLIVPTSQLVTVSATELLAQARDLLHILEAPILHTAPGEVSGLLVALLWGDTSYLSSAFKAALRVSGTTHLVALSGYNVTMLFDVVLGAGAYCFSRRIVTPLAFIALLLFALLTGLQPSLLRATGMGMCALIGYALGRRVDPVRSLVLTSSVLGMCAPSLFISLGFQLSCATTIGLIWCAQPRDQALVHHHSSKPLFRRLSGIWEGVVRPGMVAHVAATPLLAFHFGLIYPCGALATMVLAPIVPVAMALTALVVGVGFVLPTSLTAIAALPAVYVARSMAWIITHTAQYNPVIHLRIGTFSLVLTYVVFSSFVYYWYRVRP